MQKWGGQTISAQGGQYKSAWGGQVSRHIHALVIASYVGNKLLRNASRTPGGGFSADGKLFIEARKMTLTRVI